MEPSNPSRKSRLTKGGRFGSMGVAAQRQAIESTKAIAGVSIKSKVVSEAEGADVDLESIVSLLRGQGGDRRVAVSEVAGRLGWPAARAAAALTRGGTAGRLKFSVFPGRGTLVELV